MNIIGIYGESVYSRLDDFYRTGNYRAIPFVIRTVNGERPEFFCAQSPFRFFRKDMELRELDYISQKKGVPTDFLQRPDEAYRHMQKLASNQTDRVVADMMSTVIVDQLKAQPQREEDEENLFFICNPSSEKIIGRLGYLYLEQKHTTICFVSYQIASLMTNVISQGESRLAFDIGYFLDHQDQQRSDIYPNDYRESMLQTVFYRMDAPEGEHLPPLRIDIFSQGLSNGEIGAKAELIGKVLGEKDSLSAPFRESGDTTSFLRIPKVLYDCIEAAKLHYRAQLEQMLEER